MSWFIHFFWGHDFRSEEINGRIFFSLFLVPSVFFLVFMCELVWAVICWEYNGLSFYFHFSVGFILHMLSKHFLLKYCSGLVDKKYFTYAFFFSSNLSPWFLYHSNLMFLHLLLTDISEIISIILCFLFTIIFFFPSLSTLNW